MFGRSRLRKSQQKNERRWRKVFKNILVVVLIVLPITGLLYGVWFISRLPALTISQIEVVGGETVPKDELKKTAEAELQGLYYRIWPKRFAWTYPEEQIKTKLSQLPRVKDVTVERVDGRTIIISFSEYRPHALWCERENQAQCFFIDDNGRAFAAAPSLIGSAFLRFVDHEREPSLHADNFGSNLINYAEELVVGLGARFGFGVVYFERIHEDDFFVYLSDGGILKINTTQTATETLDNLSAILSSKEFSHLKGGGFEYVDLRYGNKVFVKEKESLAKTSSSTDEILTE